MTKAAVGLSGGVDSALAAALLKEQGYKVTGVFIECWNKPGCRTDQDRKDALEAALKLKITFKVLGFKKEYKQKVLDIFYREYRAGRTPNPDILCNQEIKFGLFLKWALKNKFDYLATGHYARIIKDSTQRGEIFRARVQSPTVLEKFTSASVEPVHLYQSVDKKKDQTYFLGMLKEKQLRRVLFPIGHLLKRQVRLEAKKRGLKVWNKKDSTGICFVGHDLNFRKFLKREIKEHRGEVIRVLDLEDDYEVIGRHKGVEFYTIGQRHGFSTNSKRKTQNAKPLYVIYKDIKRNRLIVGRKADLAKKELEVEKWSWIGKTIRQGRTLTVKIRHQGRLIGCKIVGKKVILERPEYGIAAGQAAVIYQKTEGSDPSVFECLGGGVIKG